VTRFVVADDGHGEPVLWAELGGHLFPVVSRSRLDQPSYWGDLVVAVLAGQEAVERIADGLSDTPCGQCGHPRYEHDGEGCTVENGRPDSCECVCFGGPRP
jgi:hypothetical protein